MNWDQNTLTKKGLAPKIICVPCRGAFECDMAWNEAWICLQDRTKMAWIHIFQLLPQKSYFWNKLPFLKLRIDFVDFKNKKLKFCMKASRSNMFTSFTSTKSAFSLDLFFNQFPGRSWHFWDKTSHMPCWKQVV